MKLTGSLVVCAAAGLFTAGALVLNDGPSRRASADAPRVGSTTQVEISGFRFTATPVAPGSTVTVANRDGESHTLTASDGDFDTGPIPSGTAVAFIAPFVPGTYEIVCTIHPSMHGQLVVT